MLKDEILCYLLGGGQARAYVARTADVAAAAMDIHGLTHTSAAALGRALTCAAIMGVQMKHEDDRLSVTIKGGGPLGTITVAARMDGRVKGMVQNPGVELPPRPDGKLDVGRAVGRDGRVTVIKDMGMKEPYIGNSPLQSGEIADDFAYYFTVSEQQPCAVALGVMLNGGAVVSAGGIILQPLPGCGEDMLSYLESCGPLLAEVSSLFVDNSAADVGRLLFWQTTHSLEASFPVAYACDCNRERLSGVLMSLGADELRDMMVKSHGAELTCHFCNTVYTFTEDELADLAMAASGGG